MTRWILCPSCGDAYRQKYPRLERQADAGEEVRYAGLLFPGSIDGPAERGTMARGFTKYAMFCDHCNGALPRGAVAWAVGIVVDGMTTAAAGWESEYLSLKHDRGCNVYLDDEGDIDNLTDAQLCTCGLDDSGWQE